MAVAQCNVCKDFRVPWDNIGAALMTEHFTKSHPEITLPDRATGRAQDEASPVPYASCGRCHGTGVLSGWQGRCPQCGGKT